jgi:FOG: EAL domain
MKEMKKRNCLFSLDDFGSGLSSFAYLKDMPVDYLKIDGHFIKNITHDAVDKAFVQSIHQIARVMKIQTVAEFVENDNILNVLKDIGIDYAQGYGISKPHPLKDLNVK